MKTRFSYQRFLFVNKWNLVCLVILIGLLSGNHPAHAAKEITANTRWTKANSPYWFAEDVIVKPGVTLIVEPGVEVIFQTVNHLEGTSNRAELIVEGSLTAVGTIDHPIRFTSDTVADEMGGWAGIYLYGNNSRLEYIKVDHAMTGLTISSGAEVRWSKIEKNLETGIQVTISGTPTLLGNEITYNRVGLALSGGGIVQENRFMSNSYGIIGAGVKSINFEGNSFESNNYGIYLENSGAGNQIQSNLINNNDYGIYVDGGTPPVVHYNDLYNNRVYDFYHLTQGNTDARYNWWGTTDTNLIDAYIYDQKDNQFSVLYGYVDYSSFLQASALAPTIVSLTATPAAVRSGTVTVTILFSKEMAIQYKPVISYGLYEPYTSYMVTTGTWLSLTKYQFTLNIGESMAEGQYRFSISGAESTDGQKLKSNYNYTFVVDRTPPTVYTGVDYFTFSPNGDGEIDRLDAELFFDEPAKLTYSIMQGETVISGPHTDTGYLMQKVLSWDGRNSAGVVALEGEYALHLTVEDQAGNKNATPVVLSVYIDNTPPTLVVDPVSGIQTGNLAIAGAVRDNTNPMTYLSYRLSGTTSWIRLTQLEGAITGTIYTWDLTGLVDGAYELLVEVVDLAGNRAAQTLNLEVDVKAPIVKLTLPEPDAHLTGEAVFSGTVSDYHLSQWKLELEVQGVWTELAGGLIPVNGEIIRLNLQTYTDGEYRVRLTANDAVGRVSSLEQRFHIDNATPPEVLSINVGPQYFSPNGDGFSDRVRFLLNFSEKVYTELVFTDSSGQKVRRLVGEGQQLESYWDGKDDNDLQVVDGSYSYQLNFVDQVGHVGVIRTGQLVVDTVAPTLEISSMPNVTNKTTATVQGQVADFAQVLVNGKKIVVDNGKFTSTVNLVEGMNQISVIAEDQAGNRAVRSFGVKCDTSLPVFYLNPVKGLTNQPQLMVEGHIEEANLVKAALILKNALGVGEKALVLDEMQNFTLTRALAVGENQLQFVAQDEAGNVGESIVLVEYLPTIPEIYLLEPARPFLAEANAKVVLKVLEGSVPLDPASITVEVDGVPQTYQWNAATKEVSLQLTNLAEGAHQLRAGARNTQGEAGGGLNVTLVVDLTDPQVNLWTPLTGSVLDGWDGIASITGSVSDAHLDQLTVSLISKSGSRRVLAAQNLQTTEFQGELAQWSVGEWANGFYTLEVSVTDLAGRKNSVARNVEVCNTGEIRGRVTGDLASITESVLYLVQGKEISEDVSFDLLTGDFTQRVPVGQYDLALAPWGYTPVVLPNLSIKVGQTLANLQLNFSGKINWNMTGGKQLVAVPFVQTGVPDGAQGKIVTFKNYTSTNYADVKDWTQLKAGRGYWVNFTDALTLSLKGHPVQRTEYRLSLLAGWNLISTPFNYPYPLNGLAFVIDGHSYSFSSAKQAGKVDLGVWKYQEWYKQADRLEPWTGYWLYSTGAGEVIFNPEQADLPYKRSLMVMQTLSTRANTVQSPEWEVQIGASLGDALDVENYFGTAKSASTGMDQGLDLREPPGFTPYVSLYFSETGVERLTSSYQSPVQGMNGKRQWEMVVESGTTGWVELKWNLDPEAILHLTLTDQTTGESIDMFRKTSYQFYHRGGGARKFTLTAVKGNFAIQRLYNYANPFAASGSGQLGTRIRYLMTHDAEVQITIMDAVGRVVKRYSAMAAGTNGGSEGWNEIYWDGRNSKGNPVANGVYVVKVKAFYGKKYYVKMGKMATINGR